MTDLVEIRWCLASRQLDIFRPPLNELRLSCKYSQFTVRLEHDLRYFIDVAQAAEFVLAQCDAQITTGNHVAAASAFIHLSFANEHHGLTFKDFRCQVGSRASVARADMKQHKHCDCGQRAQQRGATCKGTA